MTLHDTPESRLMSGFSDEGKSLTLSLLLELVGFDAPPTRPLGLKTAKGEGGWG